MCSRGRLVPGVLKVFVLVTLLAGAAGALALLAPAASGQQKEAASGGEEFARRGLHLKEAQGKLDVKVEECGLN